MTSYDTLPPLTHPWVDGRWHTPPTFQGSRSRMLRAGSRRLPPSGCTSGPKTATMPHFPPGSLSPRAPWLTDAPRLRRGHYTTPGEPDLSLMTSSIAPGGRESGRSRLIRKVVGGRWRAVAGLASTVGVDLVIRSQLGHRREFKFKQQRR